jgi:hypothetical protein
MPMGQNQEHRLSVDKNILTYLLEVSNGDYDSERSRQGQRWDEAIAAFRIMLYCGPFYVGETVKTETEAIRNAALRGLETSFTEIVLLDLVGIDSSLVEERVRGLAPFHKGENDRRVLAEAEAGGMTHFVTNDEAFIKHLAPPSKVRLLRPSHYWDSREIPRGIKPTTSPAKGHPLYGKSYWLW